MSTQHQNNNDLKNVEIEERNKKKKLKSISKPLLQVNFETVIVLLKLNVNSYEKTLFLLIVLSFLMCITSLNLYLNQLKEIYPSISTTSVSFSLMDSLRYLDIAQLIGYGGSASGIVAIFCSGYMIGMVLLFLICFTSKYYNENSKPRKYFFGRWFVNLVGFFTQLLSFPFTLIFSAFIICSKQVLSSYSDNCEKTEFQIEYSLSIVGVIFVIISEFWIQSFFYNTKHFKKDAKGIDKDPRFLLEWSIYRFSLAFFTSAQKSNSYTYFCLFLGVQTGFSLYLYIKLAFTLSRFTFSNPSVSQAYLLTTTIFLSQYLSFLTDEICRATNFYSKQDEMVLILNSVYLLLLLPVTFKLRASQLQNVLFNMKDISKVSLQSLIFRIAVFQQLNSQTTTEPIQDSIFKGILNEHLNTHCPHPNQNEFCFCKQRVLYDPKKRKDTPIDKMNLVQNNSIFAKFLVKSWFETYLNFNPTDNIAYLAYVEFLYFKMKNVSLALKNIGFISNKYLTPIVRYRLFRLNATILKHNRKRNHDSYRMNQSDKDNRNKLEIETVIPVEEQISQIMQGIKFIIKNNIRFWAYLQKANINLNQINHLAKFSLSQLDQLKKLWKESMYYLDYRKKWRFYYCWYHLYILNKKIKVAMLERFSGTININENDVFSEELVQDHMEDDVHSVQSNMKADEMEKIFVRKVEMAFDKKSVVFHVNHEYKGKILKVNRAIYFAFGYSQLELTGQVYITTLMPRLYSQIHPALLNNFAQTGKTKTLYSQRKVFCINKQGYLFPAWKFVKQYVTLTGRCEYIAMIRPITPPAGTKIYYIILNDDWEIDSMSEQLYEGLGLNPLVYQNENCKQLLSLLILCPKMIRFTRLAKQLTEYDYKLFHNREQEKIVNKEPGTPTKQIGQSHFNTKQKKKDGLVKQNSQEGGQEPESTANNTIKIKALQPPNIEQQFLPRPPVEEIITPPKEVLSVPLIPLLVEKKMSVPTISISDSSPLNIDFTSRLSPSKRQNKRKITVIPSLIQDEGFEPQEKILNEASNKIKEEEEEEDNTEKEKRKLAQQNISTQDIMEQLNMGQNNQFLQTNFIRDEIMKKKKEQLLELEQDSLVEEEEKDEDSEEQKSEGNEKEFEESETEFVKLDNLEKGDQLHFRLKIPNKISELISEYHQKVNSFQKRNSRIYEEQTPKKRSVKQIGTMTTVRSLNNQISQPVDSRDKNLYSLIREMIIKYNHKKSQKEFSAICTASFKKIIKSKMIILKLTKFDEVVKKQRGFNKQGSGGGGGNDNYQKKLITMTSGVDFQKQNSFQENISQRLITCEQAGISKLNQSSDPLRQEMLSQRMQYLSMRSEISRESIRTNTFQKPQRSFVEIEETQNKDQIQKSNGMGYQIKTLKTPGIEEIQDEESNRSLTTFHKDFANRSGAKNISLSQSDNIFIKEDNHKPNKNIDTISNLKIFIRLFFLILIALNSFTFFYGPNYQFPQIQSENKRIFEAKNVLLSALKSYNLILDQIIVNSGKYVTEIADSIFWDTNSFQAMLREQFLKQCDYFYTISSSSNYRETFFDQKVTPYSEFKKQLFDNGSNLFPLTEYTLDSYDLFSQMILFLQTIQQQTPASIQLSDEPVNFFRINTFPNLYDGLMKAQHYLINDLSATTDSIYQFLIIIIMIESFLFFLSFIILFRLIILICNAFKSVIQVFPKISQRDLKKIKNYNINLNINFSYITEKDDYLSGTHPLYQHGGPVLNKSNNEQNGSENGNIIKKKEVDYDLEEPNDGTENVGKKSKDIEEGGFLKELRMKILSLFSIFVVIVGCFSAIFLFIILQSTTNLQLVITNGEVFMSSFGINVAMMIAIKEKFLDLSNYDAIYKAKIQSLIDQFQSQNLQPNMDSISFSNFDEVFNQLYYGSPCDTFSSLLTDDSTFTFNTECLTIAAGSLQQGMASFNSFYKNAIINFVNNGMDGDKLSMNVIFEYNRGVYYSDLFLVNLVQLWSSNTESYLSGQLSIIILFVIIMLFALFLVYLIIAEKLMLDKFESEYSYFRTIYKMYMPDIIILKEKRIKFWLVKYSVINK